MKSKIISLLTAVFLCQLLGCASASKKFEQRLSAGSCEDAAVAIPEQKDPGLRLLSQTKEAGGTLASYAVTGVSYTVEVLWDFTGATVMVVALCGPSIAAEAASHAPIPTGGGLTAPCLPGKFSALSSPPLGRRTFRATENLRCPDVTSLSQSIRKVAACYVKRNSAQDLKKAEESLVAIKNSGDFYRCLSTDEQGKLSEQLSETQKVQATPSATL